MTTYLTRAAAYLENGRPDLTEVYCRAELSHSPKSAAAMSLWARARLTFEGPQPQARDLMLQAVDVSPDDAEAHQILASAQLRLGEAVPAEGSFRRAQALGADDGALRQIANLAGELAAGGDVLTIPTSRRERVLAARCLVIMKRYADALPVLEELRREDPKRASILPSLFRCQAGLGRLDEALDTARALWSFNAHWPPFRRHLYGHEITSLCMGLAQTRPDDPVVQTLLAAVQLASADQFQSGIVTINGVLSRGTNDPEALHAGALAALKQGDFASAETIVAAFRSPAQVPDNVAELRAVLAWIDGGDDQRVPPDWPVNRYMLLADALLSAERLRPAETVLAAALMRDGDREDVAIQLAHVRAVLGDFDGAGEAAAAALEVNPWEPRARMSGASLNLCKGALTEAWQDYEFRFQYWRRDTPFRTFEVPRWTGDANVAHSLLVWREEGIGDEIRFASCLPDLVEAGIETVIFECTPRLVALYARSFPDITVRAESDGGRPADIDAQVPLFSLPGILRNDMEAFPSRRAYLQADPAQRDHWRQRYADMGPGPKVGICWRSLNASWAKRPFHSEIDDWGPILGMPGVTFVNLQVGVQPDELAQIKEQHGVTIHDIPGLDLKDDLDGVAAAMDALDAVIAARCWVPILAGALGVETFCFTRLYNPFFFGRERDPWMPSVRVYYEDGLVSWPSAMERIASDLGTALSKGAEKS